MDLLFSKYASPFVLLEQIMMLGRLSEFVVELVQLNNDKKLWNLYLACVANPFSEVTSFDEFKRKNTNPTVGESVDLEATVKQSINVLQNFKPE